MTEQIVTGITIPFLGTAIGAATVLFLRKGINDLAQKLFLGFASGVMVAASFWSLLQPALEETADGTFGGVFPVLMGFIAGMGFLFALDTFIPHQHIDENTAEGPRSSLPRSTKLILAVALHNIPEGMAVGVVFAGMHGGDTMLTLSGAFALSIGMAIQNIPEGAIISMPLLAEGKSRGKAFAMGVLSGLVEPVAAVCTMLFLENAAGAMPMLLAFAAGAMLYVIVEELVPASQSGRHSNIGTVGFAVGFAMMMVLDSVLG